MKRFFALRCLFLAALFFASQHFAARAAVVLDGDVDANNPDAWIWPNERVGYVGKYGEGTIDVTDGSGLESEDTYIGYALGSTGRVSVDGEDTTWGSNEVFVGFSGIGELQITGGGVVKSRGTSVGHNADSTGRVTVDGDGSTWTNVSELYVGYSGRGTVKITGGGYATTYYPSFIGHNAGSIGLVTVNGAGSAWTAPWLSVGNSDFGSGGGVLSSGTLFASPTQLTGTGTINTQGLVSDLDLVFDSSHGVKQTFTWVAFTWAGCDRPGPTATKSTWGTLAPGC
jgi:T5SS/PEP-CTERM-associated repeat protein